MITPLNSRPQVRSTSRFQQALAQQSAPGVEDRFELSSSAPPPAPPQRVASGGVQQTGSKTGARILAGFGLLGVALSLAGCTGGGQSTPTPPQQTEAHAANAGQRLEQLRNGTDRNAYVQMAQASYYHRVLDAISHESDPAAKAVVELATKGAQAYDFNGVPTAQLTNQQDVLQAIAQGERADGVVGRYQDVARAALEIGDALGKQGPAADGGLVSQLKTAGYEQALQQIIQKLPMIPDQVHQQSGIEVAVVRNYTEGLSTTAQVALDAGKELNDPALQGVLYESTATQLYTRIKADGNVVGGQLQTVLETIQKIKNGGGGILDKL